MDPHFVLGTLAQSTRRQILDLVMQKPRSLTELSVAVGRTVPCVLMHVNRLQAAGLVVSRRKGKRRLVRSRHKRIYLALG